MRVRVLLEAWLRGATEGGRYATMDQIAGVLAITRQRVLEGTA